MARTLLDMRTRMQEMASVDASAASRLNDLINEAIVDWAVDTGANPVLASFNTVIGQTSYSLASLTANGALRILPDAEGTDRGFDLTVRGLTTIVLPAAPTAVVAVNVWVVPRPTELTADADPFPFEREWYAAVVNRALQLTMEWDRQDPQDIIPVASRYQEDVARARRARKHVIAGNGQQLQPSAQLNTSAASGPFPFSL